jgi:hypothetical protein
VTYRIQNGVPLLPALPSYLLRTSGSVTAAKAASLSLLLLQR